METRRDEARFFKKNQELKKSKAEIKEVLRRESELFSPEDRLRLTRTLQLLDRYAPKRETSISDHRPTLTKVLETLMRFLPTERKKTKRVQKPEPAQRSFSLSENSIEILRELRALDRTIRNEPAFSNEGILDQERPKTVKSEETLDTSITLDYEKKRWGVERICLDGIQNHLPEDSKGSRVWIRCLVADAWVSMEEGMLHPREIQAVRFVDDGVGFDVRNLTLLHSLKTQEEKSAGQFGEGMKLVAAAALREGLDMELESQTWSAKPTAKKVSIKNHRTGKIEQVEQLAFRALELDSEAMVGSRTTFWKPTPAFLEELGQIKEKMLVLRDRYRPLFSTEIGEIVDRVPGRIFAKGIYITTLPTLFSYNFNDLEPNRDRNMLDTGPVRARVGKIIVSLSDHRMAKTFLHRAITTPDAFECDLYNRYPDHPEIWQRGFSEAFGKDAVLDTGFRVPEALSRHPLKKIKLPSNVATFLLRAGVKTERHALPEFWDETIPTSLTIDYGEDQRDEERLLLDAVQNHLPHDSGGSMIGLRVRTTDGHWHPYEELSSLSPSSITALKIFDNGNGYDHRLLGLLYSTKTGTEGAGKFGEGLKMLSAAALRCETSVRLRSRNWTATPKTERQEVDGHAIDQLVFDVVHSVHGRDDDGDSDAYGVQSSTTFEHPSPRLIEEFRQLPKKVLSIERRMPIESTASGEILETHGGLVFARDILIPGDHHLAFSYHFPKLEIKNRDRNVVGQQDLNQAIRNVLKGVTNTEVIREFFFQATREALRPGERLEFLIDFLPQDRGAWKQVYFEMFGTNTAVRDSRSQEFDGVGQLAHVGLEVVSFPSAVYRLVQSLGDIPTYESRMRELSDVEEVPLDQLTEQERGILKILEALDVYLPNNRPSALGVYRGKHEDQVPALGLSDGTRVRLNRAILQDLLTAADVYMHEKTHHNTGSADASAKFRDYLSLALAKLALDQLKQSHPEVFES